MGVARQRREASSGEIWQGIGLEPMTKSGLSNAANEDTDSNSDTEFGGEDTFEDFGTKNWWNL